MTELSAELRKAHQLLANMVAFMPEPVSPWTDLTVTAPSYAERAGRDPFVWQAALTRWSGSGATSGLTSRTDRKKGTGEQGWLQAMFQTDSMS